MAASKNEPISITQAELKLLEALIQLEQEERKGSPQRVTIYDSPDALAFWGKVGRWVWKNRYKLVALTQAAYDLVGLDAAAEPGIGKINMKALNLADETSLDDLIAARDQVHRAMEKQGKKGRK